MNDLVRIPIEFPLDSDGFLRRECPSCERQFKWHHDSSEARGGDGVEQYFCPLCGRGAAPNEWWTPAQLDYARGVAGPAMDQLVNDQLDKAFKGFRSNRNVKFKRTRAFTWGIPTPQPLVESDDMLVVEPPCHPDEPIKIPEDWAAELHCLVCGSKFVA